MVTRYVFFFSIVILIPYRADLNVTFNPCYKCSYVEFILLCAARFKSDYHFKKFGSRRDKSCICSLSRIKTI